MGVHPKTYHQKEMRKEMVSGKRKSEMMETVRGWWRRGAGQAHFASRLFHIVHVGGAFL
jgi:hypothetical protein